jgi:hypothetical protein
VDSNVPEKHTASIFRAEVEWVTDLKTEAAYSSEKLGPTYNTHGTPTEKANVDKDINE